MAVVTTRQLLDSGVHFGHQTRRWNPKMKKFIFTERNGIYIIDLQQSLSYIDTAYGFVKDTVARGGQVLFIGTKKQAQEAIAEQATRVGMPYVNQRWLGGMLTNFGTISKRIAKMKELEGINFDDVASSGLTKKELLQQKRKKEKLAKTLGGIRDMHKLPQAIWVVDTNKEHLAIDEARKLRIPIVGILDTNCDPDQVDFPIPGNDDAIRSVALLTRVLADAVAEGLLARSSGAATGEEAEPMPDWERDLLATADNTPVSEAEALEGSDLQANQLADAVDGAVAEVAAQAEAAAEVEAAEEAAAEEVEPAVEAAAEVAEPVAEAEVAEPAAAKPAKKTK
ncbi:30S ribosomal protein S2 [Propionicimonas sp.]|uniref:30S ribosomal protein S2 n=1 Tax=Propionicimonas sp. TaxID=1955623 RepID=UPI0039E6B59F